MRSQETVGESNHIHNLPVARVGEGNNSKQSKILIIPNELSDKIVSYLTPTEQVNAMMSCNHLHDVTSRRLYRHIHVTSCPTGFILFNTLATTKKGYGKHVRSLHFGSRTVYYNKDSHGLLARALPTLKGIKDLSIEVQDPFFAASFLSKKSMGSDSPATSRWVFDNLYSLRSLRLHDDLRLFKLCRSPMLERITVANELTSQQFKHLLHEISHNGPNTCLKELELTFSSTVNDQHITSCIHIINIYCPKIERLRISAAKIDALVSNTPTEIEQS